MKIVSISRRGVSHPAPTRVPGKRGPYYALLHGEQGRGRWQVRWPLGHRDFPAPEVPLLTGEGDQVACPRGHAFPAPRRGQECPRCAQEVARGEPLEGHYALQGPLGEDPRGNPRYRIVAGRDPEGTQEDQLVLLHLDPGFRGGARYEVSGAAQVLALGHQAQGDAGRMGGAPCPVLYVTGPTEIRWVRGGRLYGSPSRWVARFDGEDWTVLSAEEEEEEAAAFD